MSLHMQNFFSAILIVFLINIYNSTNVYYSILLLINIFVIYFIFLMILNFDFIAQALLIIYAGAVVILFLLVIMLFDAPKPENIISLSRSIYFKYFYFIGLCFWCITLLFFIYYQIISFYLLSDISSFSNALLQTTLSSFFENTCIVNLGNHLFNFFYVELLVLGQLFIVIIFGISTYFKINRKYE